MLKRIEDYSIDFILWSKDIDIDKPDKDATGLTVEEFINDQSGFTVEVQVSE